jgi:beta-glucosidase
VQEEGNTSDFVVSYAQGSPFTGSAGNATLIAEAVEAVRDASVILLNLGLGNAVEGEGLDRSYLTFPPPQMALIDAVLQAKGGTCVPVSTL